MFKAKVRGKGAPLAIATLVGSLTPTAEVAVKKLRRKGQASFAERDIAAFEEEVAVMRRIYHPNIVLLMGAWFSSTGDELLMGAIPEFQVFLSA